MKNGHRWIMKERKLTNCDNGRTRRTGIMRGEGIKSRRYGDKSRRGFGKRLNYITDS